MSIFNPYVLIAIVLSVIGAFGGGYYKGSKDEFNRQQLEIAKLNAEARQKEYESARQPDAIDFPQAQSYEEPKNTPDTTAQFDQLTTSSSETSFDDLQKDYTPVKQEPAVDRT